MGEFGVGGRLIPAHPGHGMIFLAFGIVAALPGRGSGPARSIDEFGHGLVPGQFLSFLDELVFPVFFLLVSAFVHEVLVLLIRDLEPVHEIVLDLAEVFVFCPCDPDHSCGDFPGFVQAPEDLRRNGFGRFGIEFP